MCYDSNQFSKTKPKTGNLYYNGKLIKENKPFSIIGAEKKRLIALGYKKELFKISYYYERRNNNNGRSY